MCAISTTFPTDKGSPDYSKPIGHPNLKKSATSVYTGWNLTNRGFGSLRNLRFRSQCAQFFPLCHDLSLESDSRFTLSSEPPSCRALEGQLNTYLRPRE